MRAGLGLKEQNVGPDVSDHMVPARPAVHVVALVCVLVLICFGSSGSGQPRQTAAPQLALVGGTIYVSPTEDPIPDGVVAHSGWKDRRRGATGSLFKFRKVSGFLIVQG